MWIHLDSWRALDSFSEQLISASVSLELICVDQCANAFIKTSISIFFIVIFIFPYLCMVWYANLVCHKHFKLCWLLLLTKVDIFILDSGIWHEEWGWRPHSWESKGLTTENTVRRYKTYFDDLFNLTHLCGGNRT